MRRKITFLILFTIILAQTTSAYIDPGTGGAIINSISPIATAIIAAIAAFFVKFFFKPIKNFFKRIWGIIFNKK